jgi:uncharacterized protein (TIGR02145 family)
MKTLHSILLISSLLFSACKTEQLVDPICKDGNGNVYDTVTIGTQTWMKENLRATKYNDGTAIPLVSANDAWKALTTPAYCFMNNDTANAKPNGALYNWYVISTEKVCPDGWHIPSKDEWQMLIDYLGGDEVAGGKMKITGTEYWEEPNYGADNSSRFSAYPNGYRWGENGNFAGSIYNASFWSTTNIYDAKYRLLLYARDSGISYKIAYFNDGYPIRCLMNNQQN